MKKIFLLSAFILVFLTFSSCQKDDSLDPRPTIVDGQYVRLDITKKRLSFDHLDTAVFGGTLTAPGGNVQKYELYVRRTNQFGVTTGNYVKLPLEVTTFPYELSVTPEMIASALGVPASSLLKSDVFRFLGYSYNSEGKVADYNSLSATVKTAPGMKQGYKFMTDLVDDSELTVDKLSAFNNYQL